MEELFLSEFLSYIEAHGTGTELGDPIEINGLKKAFEEMRRKKNLPMPERPYCGLGSVKTNIGHLESAAGIAAILKVVLSLKYGKLPASLHLKELNPYINLDKTPFYIVKERETWQQTVKPRTAGVSSFGFGGSNAHVVISEYIRDSALADGRAGLRTRPLTTPHLIILSAKNEERLRVYARNIAEFLEKNKTSQCQSTALTLQSVAYTLQKGREPMPYRLAAVVTSIEDAAEKLNHYSQVKGAVENLYTGDIKTGKEKTGLLIDGKAGEAFIRIILQEKDLSRLARLWVSGVEIDWALLYPDEKPACISLPTYPFEKIRYWIPEPEPQISAMIRHSYIPEVTDNQKKVSQIYYENRWRVSNLRFDIPLNPLKYILFDTDETLFHALKERTDKENRIILVMPGDEYQRTENDKYKIKPQNPDDYKNLLKELAEEKSLPDRILHFWSLKEIGFFEKIQFLSNMLESGFYSVFYLTQALAAHKRKEKIRLLYSYTGDPDNPSPQYAALSGFLKSVSLENPALKCKSLALCDVISDKERLADIILNESEDEDKEVRYASGERYIRQLHEFDPDKYASGEIPLKKNGIYLITGGAGGLGLIFAEYLAKTYQAKLALAGRSELPPEKEEHINRIRESGSEIIYFRADVSKQAEAEELIRQVRGHYSRINGIIHCAGVGNIGFITEKTRKSVEAVLSPKVYGTVNLDRAAKDERLDFFVLFSSVAAVTESLGMSDYAFANSFMDHFAELREQLRLNQKRYGKTLSINWPLWEHGGMQVHEQSRKILAQTVGMRPLKTESGIKAFVKGLTLPQPGFLIIEGDPQKIREAFSAKVSLVERNQIIPISDDEALQDKIRIDLLKMVSGILKVKEEHIDSNENMEEYGFDSITLTQLATIANDTYKFDVPVTPAVFFEYPSIDSFAEFLLQKKRKHILQFYADAKEPMPKQSVGTPPKQSVDTPVSKPTAKRQELRADSQMIAIIGMSCIFPQSEDIETFWNHLENGDDLITEIPLERWNAKMNGNTRWGGFVKDMDKFDASFFGISPKEAELTDPQQRIFMQTVWNCIENAGIRVSDLSGTETGLFVGITTNDYNDLLKKNQINDAYMITGLTHSVTANRISYLLNLRGPSEAIDTACSSSLVAICRAVEAIRSKRCEMAIAGGVNALLSPDTYITASKAGMLSKDGRCKTFDKKADGYVRGEGAGAVFLKPLEKAEADHDYIYAVIRGIAVNHGGRSNSLTAPNTNAQAELIISAFNDAGIDPATVTYIETHGTGTKIGDPVEIDSLKKAFEELSNKKGVSTLRFDKRCGLGSVKTNIGHLESASGIAGLIKTVLSVKHGKIPCNLHFEELNPYISLDDTPFYVVNKTSSWERIRNNGHPVLRRAGVSSFGFGGTNAHVVVEEYPQPAFTGSEKKEQMIFLSAKDEDRLRAYSRKMADYLKQYISSPEFETPDSRNALLGSVAHTLQIGREPMQARLAAVVSDIGDLIEKLNQYSEGVSDIKNLYTGNAKNKTEPLIDGREGAEFFKIIMQDQKIDKLARLWVSGSWKDLEDFQNLQNLNLNKIPLPTYPFAGKRYWIPVNSECKDAPCAPIEANTEDNEILEMFKKLANKKMTVTEVEREFNCKGTKD